MNAKWILAILAAVFLILAIAEMRRHPGRISIAARTWMLITLIFGSVSGYLFLTP